MCIKLLGKSELYSWFWPCEKSVVGKHSSGRISRMDLKNYLLWRSNFRTSKNFVSSILFEASLLLSTMTFFSPSANHHYHTVIWRTNVWRGFCVPFVGLSYLATGPLLWFKCGLSPLRLMLQLDWYCDSVWKCHGGEHPYEWLNDFLGRVG